MSIGLARLEGLWCGQGMAHLLKLYHDPYADPDGTAPDVIALFDFGTSGSGLNESKAVLGISAPVKAVIDAFLLQMAAGKTPKLDLVLISHQDEDHWKLIGEMINEVKKRNIPLEVAAVIYGGVDWEADAIAMIERLVQYIPGPKKQAYPLPTNFSDYNHQTRFPTVTFMLENVIIRTLIACASIARKSRVNGTSAVIMIEFNGQGFLLPGDATFQTLVAINIKLRDWAPAVFPKVYMMSAPHHGALATMKHITRLNPVGLKELNDFVDFFEPSSGFASAGIRNTYKHPYRIVLNTLCKHAGRSGYKNGHSYVAYNIDENNTGWETYVDTTANKYTTLLDLDPPLKTADWIFDITSNGGSNTTARVFEAGARVVNGIPDANPDTLTDDSNVSDMDEDKRDDGDEARSTRPLLLTQPPLPDPLPGYAVRPRGLFAARVPVKPGRAEPAHRFGVTARPLPPNRRVRVAALGDGR